MSNITASIIKDLSEIPSLKRGLVWCTICGRCIKVNSGGCLSKGWPKCCGYTMTIDSPEERGESTPDKPASSD